MKATKIIAGLSVVAALGAAAVPLSAVEASPATATENINVIVNSALYLNVDGLTTTTEGVGVTDLTNLSDVVRAGSTNSTGYSLYMSAPTTADINLANGNNIIPGSATVATPGLGTGVPGTNYSGGSYTWGINSTAFSSTGGCTNWSIPTPSSIADCTAGSTVTQPAWTNPTMPTTTSALIASTAAANGASIGASNAYSIRYGVTIATDQPTGTYTAQVLFTLVDNP
ncbi:hypothetical protein FWH09_01225 [Candidatus Saccharibacteria bacterium]|nr:hypothetical protein [Candidatus Saccharibacteria bacterium]